LDVRGVLLDLGDDEAIVVQLVDEVLVVILEDGVECGEVCTHDGLLLASEMDGNPR
jgi:hypothetical protein